MIRCDACPHRQWEEGSYDYSPPGYGAYYCDLTSDGCLPEDVAKGRQDPPACPMRETPIKPYNPDADPTAGKPWPLGLDAGRMGVPAKERVQD
jgi:hypothetical protein